MSAIKFARLAAGVARLDTLGQRDTSGTNLSPAEIAAALHGASPGATAAIYAKWVGDGYAVRQLSLRIGEFAGRPGDVTAALTIYLGASLCPTCQGRKIGDTTVAVVEGVPVICPTCDGTGKAGPTQAGPVRDLLQILDDWEAEGLKVAKRNLAGA